MAVGSRPTMSVIYAVGLTACSGDSWRDTGFPGELEKFLAVDFNYLYMKALQTHKRHGLGA